MTRAPEHPSYPWHGAPPPASDAETVRSSASGRRAGVVTRCLANIVDAAVVLVLLATGYAAFAATRFLLSPTAFRFPAPSLALLVVLGLAVLAVYFAISWALAGRTYGDGLLGLRVVDDAGRRLGWSRSCARAALCVLFLAGVLWVLVSRENRSVQDLLLRTSVVYD